MKLEIEKLLVDLAMAGDLGMFEFVRTAKKSTMRQDFVQDLMNGGKMKGFVKD